MALENIVLTFRRVEQYQRIDWQTTGGCNGCNHGRDLFNACINNSEYSLRKPGNAHHTGSLIKAMFSDLCHLAALRGFTVHAYEGRLLKGPYRLEGPGVEFNRSSMDKAKEASVNSIQDQSVVDNLHSAYEAQKMIENDFSTGFGRVTIPGDKATVLSH